MSGITRDRTVTGSLLGLLAFIAVWNALAYPAIAGFDAAEHIAYARGLVEDGELPEGGASYTPPAFYALAGALTVAAEAVGIGDGERAVQLLNALLVVGTGFLLLALARLLFPARPMLRWTALAFFVSSPVVLKTAAMFHPQPLAMFLSTLSLTLACRMIVRRSYRAWEWLALGLTLGLTQLVRSVGLWTLGVVLLALLVAAVAQPERRRTIRNWLVACAAAALLLALPWYVHLQRTTDSAVFGRPSDSNQLLDRVPGAFFVSPGLPQVIAEPHRGTLPPRFFPLLYADSWGDYFGIWAWDTGRIELTTAVNRRLVAQSIAGLPLTMLALAGWFGIVALAVTRWRERSALLMPALLPAAALAGVLYYSTRQQVTDGDTVKAMFMLTAVPAWALSFGFALDVLLARSRRVAVPVLAVLAVCLVVAAVFSTFASVS